MTAAEIIAKVNEALQDDSVSPDLSDVNAAVAFIASLSYLPELVADGIGSFSSTVNEITGATNNTPIVITTANLHGLSTGEVVVVTDVLGNTAANATWHIEVLSTTTFSLLQSVGNADYISGGVATQRHSFVDMPSNYDHDLFAASSITQRAKLNIRSNPRALGDLYSISEQLVHGRLTDVAIEGTKLHGLPVPTSDDTVMLKYYRKPTTLTLLTESPTCIPAQFHEETIVAYILAKKWPLIEDSMDGKTPNTDKATRVFTGGLACLGKHYPFPSMQQPRRKRTFQYF